MSCYMMQMSFYKHITIPVTSIKENAFSGATTLTSVTIPSAITNIGNNAFKDATSLRSVTFIPGEVPLTIGEWVFYGCTSLEEISLPARLTSMAGNSNFNGCKSLTKAVFEKGNVNLSVIPQYTFANTALTELDLSGLEVLYTFYPNVVQNVSSTSVKVTLSPSQTLQYLPQKMLTNINATEIIYPEGTSSIVRNALNGYTNVKHLSLPSTLTTIEPKAFMNCSGIELLRVPSTVTSIGESAFGHESSKEGIKCVVFEQRGGEWPATPSDISILDEDTQAFCYKDITSIPDGVTGIPVLTSAPLTTYYAATSVTLPEGIEAASVTGISGNVIDYDFSEFPSGSTLPASTPVLVRCATSGDKHYPFINPAATAAPPATNLLHGSEFETLFEGGDRYYMLNDSEPYCFELIDNMSLCPADGVYLPLSSAIAGNIDRFYLDETTGIDNTYDIDTIEYSPIYTITGIIVDGEKLTPGLYISKGKKIIVR